MNAFYWELILYNQQNKHFFFLFRMAHTILNLQISGSEVKDLKLPKEEDG